VDLRGYRLVGIIRVNRVDAHVGAAVADLSLARQRRSNLLRLWLGNDAHRNRFSRDFSRIIEYACAGCCDVANRMGAFSHNVRRRHDQTALRSLLARSDLSLLSL